MDISHFNHNHKQSSNQIMSYQIIYWAELSSTKDCVRLPNAEALLCTVLTPISNSATPQPCSYLHLYLCLQHELKITLAQHSRHTIYLWTLKKLRITCQLFLGRNCVWQHVFFCFIENEFFELMWFRKWTIQLTSEVKNDWKIYHHSPYVWRTSAFNSFTFIYRTFIALTHRVKLLH